MNTTSDPLSYGKLLSDLQKIHGMRFEIVLSLYTQTKTYVGKVCRQVMLEEFEKLKIYDRLIAMANTDPEKFCRNIKFICSHDGIDVHVREEAKKMVAKVLEMIAPESHQQSKLSSSGVNLKLTENTNATKPQPHSSEDDDDAMLAEALQMSQLLNLDSSS